jgi:hypothetical protein
LRFGTEFAQSDRRADTRRNQFFPIRSYYFAIDEHIRHLGVLEAITRARHGITQPRHERARQSDGVRSALTEAVGATQASNISSDRLRQHKHDASIAHRQVATFAGRRATTIAARRWGWVCFIAKRAFRATGHCHDAGEHSQNTSVHR